MTAYIEDIARHEGQVVTLRGWLHNRRSSGKIHFLTVCDGSGFIQCVMSKKAVGDETFLKADHLAQESAVTVTGTVRADARAPGGYELDVTAFESLAPATDYPITPKEHGVDYLMDRRHLWIRSPRQQAILRLSFEGWSVQEMAEELRTPPERVSDEKYKAIRKLRAHLCRGDFERG